MASPKTQRTTNWCDVTGGPSPGKTTTVNLLAGRGYKATIEHARHYLDTKRTDGKTVGEIRSNQLEFQLGVLRVQTEQEASLSPEDLVFLDRAVPPANIRPWKSNHKRPKLPNG